MSLENKITEDMKNAMKAKDALKLKTVRTIKSQLKYFQIEKKLKSVSDDDVLTVITKMCKQRKDSIEQFKNANRDDLVSIEEDELAILIEYLPAQLGEEDVEKIVKAAIEETGATEKKHMGAVMKVVMPQVKGKADGKLVNQIAGKYLS